MSLHRELHDKRGLSKGHHTWTIIISLGRGADGKYKQRWVRFHGTRQDAEQKERDLRTEVRHGSFVEPSKLTLRDYLNEWVETAIRPRKAPTTYSIYKHVIENYINPALGHVLLQRLTVLHVQRFYADLVPKYGKTEKDGSFSNATRMQHHTVLSGALKAAVRSRLVNRNVASDVNNRPSFNVVGDVLDNVWTAQEARDFLSVVHEQCTEQDASMFSLLLDSGVRRGELLGLKWRDLNDKTLTVERQLQRGGHREPVFSPPKRGGIRTLELSDKTVELLRSTRRFRAS